MDAGLMVAHSFFMVYSRFEYALKRAGFLQSSTGRAKPNRDSFADTLEGQLSSLSDARIKAARRTLLDKPPRTQIAQDGQLDWCDTVRIDRESDERFLLRLAGTVRNNLFHGGKYPFPIGPVAEPARDTALLEATIVVVEACISLSPRVKSFYDEVT